MPVFLKPESKVALLEQSMKVKLHRDLPVVSTCFPKVLFVNKNFMGLARKHSVYRFFMYLESKSQPAKFHFKDNETGKTQSFGMSLDQAYKWIKFLNPPFFDVHSYPYDSPYFCLMGCVNGKMGFRTLWNDTVLLGIVKCFWFQINELACTAEVMKSNVLAALPSKTFDRLLIEGVESTDDLKWALKQKATRLTIVIDPEYEFLKRSHAPNEEAFVNDIVEKCTVEFGIGKIPIFGIISTVIKTCPNLKHLTISYWFDEECSPTVESTMECMGRTTLFIERLTKKLKESSIECMIDVNLDIWDNVENGKYPRDCVEMFRLCSSHFESVQEETECLPNGKFRTKFIIKHKDQNVSVDYKIDIWYDDLEDAVDEMYNENIE